MGLFDRNPNESAYEWLTSKTAVDFFGGSSSFETYVKSHISKTCGQLSMAIRLFETYVKSNDSKIYPHLQRHRQLFETYVKLLTLKNSFRPIPHT